jgi:hypothetical protein
MGKGKMPLFGSGKFSLNPLPIRGESHDLENPNIEYLNEGIIHWHASGMNNGFASD